MKQIPLIHITDLFNPPGDPDDHFDLLTLLSIPKFDVRAVVLDHSLEHKTPGISTVPKACSLYGRPAVPCAPGLRSVP